MAGTAESFVVADSEPPPSRLSIVEPVAFSLEVPLNRDTNQLQLLPVDVGNLPPPSRKHLFVVAACIFFLLVNSEAQNYYVRYSETSRMAEGNGTYLLCWFSSIFQIIIYPLNLSFSSFCCAYQTYVLFCSAYVTKHFFANNKQ